METTKKLLMTFKTDEGKKVSLSVDDPRPNITEEEIKSAMETIINSGIFTPNGESLIEMLEAKIVETDTIEYDLV
ncbi:MAG: DUF2922 domain-containing protein [Romboutsia sp.]|nr:DUF2922 domain-containing protein [Romboutsia sp.]